MERIPSPHATISPLDLEQEVLRSLESPKVQMTLTKCNLTVMGLLLTQKSQHPNKNSVKRYPYSEMRRKKSREVEWVRLGKFRHSMFDRDEIDGGSRLND